LGSSGANAVLKLAPKKTPLAQPLNQTPGQAASCLAAQGWSGRTASGDTSQL